MNTAQLSDQLNNRTTNNTVLVLSVALYDSITYVKNELPGVKLSYKPLSIYHKEFLNLLQSLDIDIICSNQELLDSLKHVHPKNVVIGNDMITSTFIKSAYINGFPKFSADKSEEVEKIIELVGKEYIKFVLPCDVDNSCFTIPGINVTELTYNNALTSCNDISTAGTAIHAALELATEQGHFIKSVNIGSIRATEDIPAMKEAINNLISTLPEHVTVFLTLEHDILASAMFLATKIIDKQKFQNETINYTVNISMFDELACYLDEQEIGVFSGEKSVKTIVYGSTTDDEDMIFEGSVGEMYENDWMFLQNVGLADCRDFELFLLDEDYRIANSEPAPEPILDLDSHLTPVEIQA